MPEQIKRIEIGDLTEAVTTAVNRALQSSPDPVAMEKSKDYNWPNLRTPLSWSAC